MAPPADDFQPHFLGNPWMAWHQVADPARARRQWEALVKALRAAGAELHLLSATSEGDVLPFTADGALVYAARQALVLRNVSARGEVEPPCFRRWLGAAGYLVDALPAGLRLDGGNIVPGAPGVWLVGVNPESTGHAERFLARLLGRRAAARLYQVPLATQRFRHLDMAFCSLGGRAYLLYPGALADRGTFLRTAPWSAGRPVLEVSPADARALGCNAVVLGDTVVTGPVSRELRHALAVQGFRVECLDLSEFNYAGGGARCLTLPLDPPNWNVGGV